MGRPGCAEREREVGRGVIAAQHNATLCQLLGFDHAHGRRRRPTRDGGEVALNRCEHGGGVKIAYGHGHGVVGRIPGGVVREEIVALHGVQVALPTDNGVAVRVGIEGQRLHFLAEQVGVGILAPLALADDYRALRLGLGGVEETVGHAIALHLQRKVNAIGGKGLEVGGPILAGHAVEGSAGTGDGLVKGAAREGVGALEEHVLHPVANARESRRFVAAAHTVEDPETGDGCAVVFAHEHLQAVGQGRAVEGLLDHRRVVIGHWCVVNLSLVDL